MRLDLFLKQTRLVRQRTLAKQLCDAGRVSVNARPAKPSQSVRPGDRLRLLLRHRALEIRVLAVPSGNVPRAGAEELYQVLRDERGERIGRALDALVELDDAGD